MSTLWTPGGDRPVGSSQPSPPPGDVPGTPTAEPDADELHARLADLQRQLAETPVEVVVANHCFGLFELAALHLSLDPPQLPQARLAIDAMNALLSGLAGRLGEPEEQLREGLAQLRLAFVQISGPGAPPPPGSPPGPDDR